jgi:plasmid stabilization system protein ParE
LTRVEFSQRAVDELQKASEWYEARQAGLGQAFIEAARETADRIAEHPRAFPFAVEDMRAGEFSEALALQPFLRRPSGSLNRDCHVVSAAGLATAARPQSSEDLTRHGAGSFDVAQEVEPVVALVRPVDSLDGTIKLGRTDIEHLALYRAQARLGLGRARALG